MRDQLVQYVNLLFAGNEEAEEIREEILQNTLDRYDDLIDQGKSPESAYRLAITGIGNIDVLMDNTPADNGSAIPEAPVMDYADDGSRKEAMKNLKKSIEKLISAVALIFFFLLSFATGAWFVTWLIFPLAAAVKGLINACIDLKGDF